MTTDRNGAATRILAAGVSASAMLLIMAGMAAGQEPEGGQAAPAVPRDEPVRTPAGRTPASEKAAAEKVILRQVRPAAPVFRQAPAAAPVHSTSRAS